MKTKKILGLDLGTNSIGAALINIPESIADFGKEGCIEWVGSRIVPIDAQYLNKWEAGSKAETKAAARRIKRGSRRLKQRYKLRRTRLIQTFKVLGWLDENFPENFKKEMNDDENFKFHISTYLPFEERTIAKATKLLGATNKKGELALPEDWIIYYLRKKALTEKISIAELCRITYMMNQRRGFKSSRKDLKDENVEEKKWVEVLKIKSVEQETFELNKNKNYKFKITVYNENIKPWFVEKKKKPEWEEKEFTFLITEKIETKKDGTTKVIQNNPQIPKEDDWALCVTAQDNQIGNEYPGTYFFNGLVNSVKNKTDFKIRQYAVYRKKYKKELEDIWKKQIELNDELKQLNTNQEVLRKLAAKLYPTQTLANKPKLNEILSHDLLHLISNDTIYYQRDLKSQKNSRGECQYEKHKGKDGESYGVKCAPKSSPEFQEMRMWQDIHNIKILQRNAEETIEDKVYKKVDIDVTENFIDDIIKEKLFELFDTSREISQQNIFDKINRHKPDANLKNETHRINMFFNEEKILQGNETKEYFRKIFRKKEFDYHTEGEKILNDKDKFYRLWNISYSISLNDEEKSKEAIFKALTEKKNKRGKEKQITLDFPENVAGAIASAPDIETTKKYASYSSKAILKLLPLMRCGKYYNETQITEKIKERTKEISTRLEAINFKANRIHEIADDDVQKQLLKSFTTKKDTILKGLNTYQACYLVYDRHSERADDTKYTQPSEFNIMEQLPNNRLRNPVVEQVIREALFVVKDVWEKYGQPDEIHIEMGRDLKKNAKERETANKNSTKNFEEKQRIRRLLSELINEEFEQYETDESIEDKEKKVVAKFEIKPNPDNPRDIDKFKLWQQSAGFDNSVFNELFKSGGKTKIPTKLEIKKYALWLSQKCLSPYSGKIIPLSKLFDGNQYDFEHILPKSKIKNDSLDNLIICEKGINKAKGGELAAKFIHKRNGRCQHGNIIYQLLEYRAYVEHCKNTFKGKKLQNLLATEIPDDFISRQLNDTRYISKKISELLYPVAKDKNSGIVFTIGSITSELKKEWGLQKEWKQLIKSRFERLEKINGAKYIHQNQKDKNDIDFHIEENPDLDIKRIDHRHHALDALIIAATTREHIRHLNNLSRADSEEEYKKIKKAIIDPVRRGIRDFALPWPSFTKDAKEKLEQTIVTFKSYNKVIDKPKNQYSKWVQKEGKWVKDEKVKQLANPKWMGVRQSLFAEQPHGKVYIKEIVEKPFEKPKQMFEIMKLQIERSKAQNTPAQKTASYIYDKEAREIVKRMIEELRGSEEEILKQLKKIKPKYSNGESVLQVKIAIFNDYAAKRKQINKDFDHKVIDKIPYAGKSRIPQALHNHLLEYEQKKLGVEKLAWRNHRLEQLVNEVKHSPILINEEKQKLLKEAQSEAFSDEGLEALEKKIRMKIRMVTLMEAINIKVPFRDKFVESATNTYFIMYENIETKERNEFKHTTLSSYEVIQKKKNGELLAEPKEGFKTIILQPNDLVYLPAVDGEGKIIEDLNEVDWEKPTKEMINKIYVVKSFSKYQIFFVPVYVASPLDTKSNELDNNNKSETAWTKEGWGTIKDKKSKQGKNKGLMIKEHCIKLNIDRLGNITPSRTMSDGLNRTLPTIVSEPGITYQKTGLRTFGNHEEMNEADAKEMAALSPAEHLQNAAALTRKLFEEELKKPMNKKLRFR